MRPKHAAHFPIEGFPNYLLDRNNEIINLKNFRRIKKTMSKEGYFVVRLKNKDGKWKRFYLHRIVCAIYHKNRWGKPFVCHRDGNKLNNDPLNLYWGTAKENMRDCKEGFNKRRLLKIEIEEIKSLYLQKNTILEISRKFSVCSKTIYYHISKCKLLAQNVKEI